MIHLFRKAALGAALVASASLAAAPAEARDRYGRHRGGDDAAIAIAAGLAGLAIGAAISSDGRRDRYYDGQYYGGQYYDGQYYDGQYYDGGYDGGRYYNGGGYYPRSSYNAYPRYNTYRYDNYDRYDRRYRDGNRYERKHRRWHRNHGD